MSEKFYYSWSNQTKATSIEVDNTEEFQFTLKDNPNKKITELSSLSFQASLGLKNNQLAKAMEEQLYQQPLLSPKMNTLLKRKVSSDLLKYLQKETGKIFYCLSGSEAIENACKMSRDITGRKTIAARKCSYHGATLGAITLSGDWRHDGTMTPKDWVLRIPEPSDDPKGVLTRKVIEEFGSDKISAICLETITGANGVIIPAQSYFDEIQKICNDYQIHLISDEVICGFARTGKSLGIHHFNLDPDFICLAKGINAGFFPMGAIWTSEKIASYYDKNILHCGLTHYAHPVGLKSIDATLKLISQDSFKSELQVLIDLFKNKLDKLKNFSGIKEVRQIGLLCAIEKEETSKKFSYHEFLDEGLSIVTKDHMIVLAPFLNMPKDLLSKSMDTLHDFLKKDYQ